MTIILASIFFIFGLIIGSFLNVVVSRFNTTRSLGGRSACMSCQNKLKWYELIPLVSFLFLKGRCRNCKTRISLMYPLVEFSTGLVFALIFLRFQDLLFMNTVMFSITFAYYAIAFSLLVVISAYDLRHKIIPDTLSLALGIFAFVGLFFFDSYGFHVHMPSIFEFITGILVALPFALFWLVSSGTWMGLGDAKLAVGLGWLLGFSRAVSGMVLAFWMGAFIGIILVLFSKKHGMKSEIPFAPYLVLGSLLAFLFELHLF